MRPRKRAGRVLAARPRWATVGDQRYYFRSGAEVDHARRLESDRRLGVVRSWEYEPIRFFFDGIRLGVTSYAPDFRVIYEDGRTEYHEVKGYMDAASITALRRMEKYFPHVVVRLFGARLPPPKKEG